ncbi:MULTISPECIES: response regulator transcription factor [Microvirga]|uniref:response regulator transcription factor n=1 Tax=Microvirga TaxID=186650 RepID=UPI001D00158D|nr:response regulator [Microvirga lenta]MCB5175745.1 response regulator [Microvirga lenta]
MSSRTGSVLIVDDDAAVRNSLKFALGIEGIDVRLYGSGVELLADADLPEHGCLVVDYQMPSINGIQLVDILRDRHRSYPTILISGHVSEDVRERAAVAGIHEVLEKPLLDETLVNSIRSALAGFGGEIAADLAPSAG